MLWSRCAPERRLDRLHGLAGEVCGFLAQLLHLALSVLAAGRFRRSLADLGIELAEAGRDRIRGSLSGCDTVSSGAVAAILSDRRCRTIDGACKALAAISPDRSAAVKAASSRLDCAVSMYFARRPAKGVRF